MEVVEALALLNKQRKYPKMHERLKRNKDIYIAMSLHTLGACPRYEVAGRYEMPVDYHGVDYHYRFDYSLMVKHPRESDATRNWRFANYRPLTKAPFGRVNELVTGAIFQDGNYTIDIVNDADREYIWGNNFHGNNLVGYFANIGYSNMVEDPNGYFVRIPKYKWDEQPEGETEVEIWFVNSEYICYQTEDELIFKRDGYAWHIDRTTIFRYKEEAKNKYILAPEDTDGYYAHMMGKLPVSVAGGQWNTKGYYDSFYDKARAAADEFVSTYSAKQLVDKEASYPWIIEVSEECPACHGVKHIQRPCETCPGGIELVDCDTCNGSGHQPSDPAKRKIVPYEQIDKQLVQVINPDTNINKHHSENVAALMKMILEALVIEIIDEAQSGVAKAIDQDRLFKFISKISNHIFDDLITETLQDIIAYRNVVASSTGVRPATYDFKIVKPTQFQIKTETDLLEDFKISRENNLPKFILAEQTKAIVDKQYGGNDVMKKKTDVILEFDRIALDTTEEKISKRLAGSITIQDMIYSDTLPLLIDKLIRDKGHEWFIDAKYEVIKTETDALLPTANPVQAQAISNME